MRSPSKLVRDVIRARLAAAYESTLTDVCREMAIARPQAIVFEPDRRARTYFEGQLTPDDIEGATSISYPYAVLYVTRSLNTDREKGRLFSGNVTAVLDLYFAWPQSRPAGSYEQLGDAVEATIYALFNDADWVESYEGSIAYTGEIDVVRRPVIDVSPNWRQLIQTRLAFQVDL